jgi:hypothetical protein
VTWLAANTFGFISIIAIRGEPVRQTETVVTLVSILFFVLAVGLTWIAQGGTFPGCRPGLAGIGARVPNRSVPPI